MQQLPVIILISGVLKTHSLPRSHTDSLAIGCEPSVIATEAGKQVAVLCVGRPRLGSERQAANLLGHIHLGQFPRGASSQSMSSQ